MISFLLSMHSQFVRLINVDRSTTAMMMYATICSQINESKYLTVLLLKHLRSPHACHNFRLRSHHVSLVATTETKKLNSVNYFQRVRMRAMTLTWYILSSPGGSRHSNSQHLSPTRKFLQNCNYTRTKNSTNKIKLT